MSMELAPIVLFVYNRPEHTRQTVEALKKNALAEDSEIFIYCDAAKDALTEHNVSVVRSYVKSISGFKSITIHEQESNLGLANSIVNGVTQVVNKYGKIIVLEDDLVTSPDFLTYMNKALDTYQSKEKVWHISGWNYPMKRDGLNDVFLWRLMNCWGWATWNDRWQFYQKNIDQTLKNFSEEDIQQFNIDGTQDFFSQVVANKKEKINTWAIFWYITIFKNNGLCLNPTVSFVENIGNDDSGTHSKKTNIYSSKELGKVTDPFRYATELEESELAISHLKAFYKNLEKGILFRASRKLKRVISENFNS